MKTILRLIETKGPGGAETVFINLFEAFEGGDFRSVALVAHGGWVHHALERAGVSAYTCDAKGSFNFGYLSKIVRVVRREQVDLIEAHLSGASLYASLAGQWHTVELLIHAQSAPGLTGAGDLDLEVRRTRRRRRAALSLNAATGPSTITSTWASCTSPGSRRSKDMGR